MRSTASCVRTGVCFGAALILVGCQSKGASPVAATAEPVAIPVDLTAKQVAEIQRGIRGSLKDPDSARFSGKVYAARAASGDLKACGLVNAKNSYGGYVGESPFYAVVRDGKVVDSVTGSGNDASIIIGMCRKDGVPL